MKRRDLVKHLEGYGCYLDREGKKHTIYRNPETGRCAAVPRHREIKNTLAKAISDQLSIPRPNV
ncbi:MAG: type II toxin-antitoxin system HicA family toxin [Planctomycetes bacterium]|nr:type II toxin-antitoxin system HicA family toxin [Planctomycetota bacterium]